jgi:sugar phosphate isomerase/epimerase
MKTCLYSITYLGIWYKGKALTWQEVLQRAKKFGYDGVEFDGKRPHANPMDWDEKTRKQVVEEADKLGLTLPALSANNDFSSPVPELRETQILMVKEQLKLARDLGCKVLRVFGAWTGITMIDGLASYDEARRNWLRNFQDVPTIHRWRFIKECLRELCKYAEEYGVVLALQNHHPITATWMDVYRMIKEVDSPWLKICYDINRENDDIKVIDESMEKVAPYDVHFHFNGEWERAANGELLVKPPYRDVPIGFSFLNHYDYFVKKKIQSGYKGYFAYEFCHNPVKGTDVAGIDFVDEQCEFALELLKKWFKEASA